MRKKKVNSDAESVPDVDLKSLIHNHSLFFDKLVELIPARFYLPTDEDKPWFQGLSKAQKASAKKEMKENMKKARRDRLDPEKSSTTTLDILKRNAEKERMEDESDEEDNDDDEEEQTEIKPIASGSVTYEELRSRLHRKIEAFRSVREHSDKPSKRFERNERRGAIYQKRKRELESESTSLKKVSSAKKVERDAAEASKELTFGHVKLGDEDDQGISKKKRRVSKALELEKAKQLREAKNDPEKGDRISKKHSWSAATSRAMGIKVHDDPKLLSKSIQKEKRKQQKNAQKWKERVQNTHKMKADRQKKRTDNITAKKQEKKTRKIEKREKKLLRPGFEGRKDGFINESKA